MVTNLQLKLWAKDLLKNAKIAAKKNAQPSNQNDYELGYVEGGLEQFAENPEFAVRITLAGNVKLRKVI
jgi:hypothetical protein